MMADRVVARRRRRLALLGVVALSMVSSGALAQGGPPPGGPPQGGMPPGGPPPGGMPPGGPPPGGLPPGGVPAGGPPAGMTAGPPPGTSLTPAQELVKSAGPPPALDFIFPIPAPLADAPMPAADPRDFQGTWIHNQPLLFHMERDMYGKLAPYTMQGAEVLVRRIEGNRAGTPYSNLSAICRPPGQTWQLDLNFPFTIFQSEDWIEVVFEEFHGRWQIILNPEAVPPPAERAYMGRSIGHWDGNTLVVETKDFKQALWLDTAGSPLSANGRLIQRIRKVDNGDREPILEIITTIDDPTYYTKPWSVVRSYGWNPNLARHLEYNCEEQIGDQSVDADAGLIPEPDD